MSNLTVREYLNMTYVNQSIGFFSLLVRPPVTCADGFSMSIQASESHHCSPRQTLKNAEEYDSVEVMILSDIDNYTYKRFLKHSESMDEIAAYVDIDFLELFVAEHGGIVV